MLTVCVSEASLVNADESFWNGETDARVTLSLGGTSCTSDTVDDSLSPTWPSFCCSFEGVTRDNAVVSVVVNDVDTDWGNEVLEEIGRASVLSADLALGSFPGDKAMVDGPRVSNHGDSQGCPLSNGVFATTAQGEAGCAASGSCGWMHDYGCDGKNWRLCGSTDRMVTSGPELNQQGTGTVGCSKMKRAAVRDVWVGVEGNPSYTGQRVRLRASFGCDGGA